MEKQLAVFEEQSPITFDAFANDEERTFWYASDLAMMLGYDDMKAINNAMNRAHAVCMQLGISIIDNFTQAKSTNCDKIATMILN